MPTNRVCSVRPYRKIPGGFFRSGPRKSSGRNKSEANGAQVHKNLKDGTKRRYNIVNRLWLGYILCPCDLLGSPPSPPPSRSTLLIFSPLIRPFNNFCAEYEKDPNYDAYDLETLKGFAQEIGYGMDGIEGEDDPPSLKSVHQTWKDFTAQFRRHHDPVPRNTTVSVTNVRCPCAIPLILFHSRKMLTGR